ncbi:hypothetical protein ACRB68_51430 [Actinomadura sp. RB68]|uniref:Uncharacterized protein n=2 Tax=Actinomadura macrotermitis TaxID=2585200 RepID=A0A7K0C114_9ACTN|nr:hypothetical protein [Actinomadura macrotermitis]
MLAGMVAPAHAAPKPSWKFQSQVKHGFFTSFATTGPTDVWTAGGVFSSEKTAPLRHWNGTKWTVLKTPRELYPQMIEGLVVKRADDIWISGFSVKNAALVAHWDGTKWTVRSWSGEVPVLGVVSKTDVWAVSDGVARHFDGRSWRAQRLALNPTAVFVAKSDDVWAVGSSGRRPAALHWDGRAWRKTTLHAPTSRRVQLNDVQGTAKSAWAYGDASSGADPFLLRWSGGKWRNVPLDRRIGALSDIEEDGSGGVYAVSNDLFHYRDGKWTKVRLPKLAGSPFKWLAWMDKITRVPGTRSFWTETEYLKNMAPAGTVLARYTP